MFPFLRIYIRISKNITVFKWQDIGIPSNTVFKLNYLSSICKTPPVGVIDFMIFGLENHKIPSHYDLHIKNFNPAA